MTPGFVAGWAGAIILTSIALFVAALCVFGIATMIREWRN